MTENVREKEKISRITYFYVFLTLTFYLVPPAMSEAEKAKQERDRLRQREQERRRREAQVCRNPNGVIVNSYVCVFQQNQIDMNRQSDMMAAFEENII